jgi:hypothetical protein
MKKFVVLSLIGLFVLAFGTAYAQEKPPVLEFKASGFIDTQTFWFKNVATSASSGIYGPPSSTFQPQLPGTTAASFDKTGAYLETRARLKFDAIMEKALSGTIFFEMDSSRWGETTPAADQRNAMGTTSTSGDRGALEIKNCYLDFGVPVIPVPITVRVGLQPLGVRPDMVMTTDGMGVTLGIRPMDPLTVGLLWAKYIEGKDTASDDSDAYGLTLAYKIQTFTLGAYGLYFNMNTYPFNTVTFTYGASASHRADFYWFGVYADGKAGPVNLKADFVYDTGEVKGRNPTYQDVDYQGWAARIYVDYPWEKFNFGAKLLYASGSDQKKTSASGLPGTTTPFGTPTKDVDSYVIPPSSEAFGAFGESIVFYGTWVNRGDVGFFTPNYNGVGRGAIGGTWFGKLYGAYKIFPEWKTTLEALYIGDTTDNGNTVGNAVKANGLPKDDSDIGIEIDWINEFMIYRNLKWDVGIGYLFAGDALDFNVGGIANNNKAPDDPWMITTRITYTF